MCGGGHIHATECVGETEDNFWELSLSLYHVAPEDQTQAARSNGRALPAEPSCHSEIDIDIFLTLQIVSSTVKVGGSY